MPKIIRVELCRFCNRDLSAGKHGVVVTIGGSKRGWGYRFNKIDLQDEVCTGCAEAIWTGMYAAYHDIVKALEETAQPS